MRVGQVPCEGERTDNADILLRPLPAGDHVAFVLLAKKDARDGSAFRCGKARELEFHFIFTRGKQVMREGDGRTRVGPSHAKIEGRLSGGDFIRQGRDKGRHLSQALGQRFLRRREAIAHGFEKTFAEKMNKVRPGMETPANRIPIPGRRQGPAGNFLAAQVPVQIELIREAIRIGPGNLTCKLWRNGIEKGGVGPRGDKNSHIEYLVSNRVDLAEPSSRFGHQTRPGRQGSFVPGGEVACAHGGKNIRRVRGERGHRHPRIGFARNPGSKTGSGTFRNASSTDRCASAG